MEGEVEELKNKLQTLPMNTLRTLNPFTTGGLFRGH